MLDRLLFSSVHYPTDYGCFPDTWALDDAPLDAKDSRVERIR